MAHVMLWFRQLARARQQGFEAPPPITWTEIAHWAALMRVQPQPWELQALTQLDDMWLGAWRRGRPKAQTQPGRKASSGR